MRVPSGCQDDKFGGREWVSGRERPLARGMLPGFREAGNPHPSPGGHSVSCPSQLSKILPPSRAHWYLRLGLADRGPGEGGSTSTADSPARLGPRPACGKERHQGRSRRESLWPAHPAAAKAGCSQAQHQRALGPC